MIKESIDILSDVSGLQPSTIEKQYPWVLKAMDIYAEERCKKMVEALKLAIDNIKEMYMAERDDMVQPPQSVLDIQWANYCKNNLRMSKITTALTAHTNTLNQK